MTKPRQTNTTLTRKEAETLLRKFMDGHTTQDEELSLRTWMETADVPDEWGVYKLLLSPVPEPADKEDLLATDYTKEYEHIVSLRQRQTVRFRLTRIAAAAVLVLTASITFLLTNREQPVVTDRSNTETTRQLANQAPAFSTLKQSENPVPKAPKTKTRTATGHTASSSNIPTTVPPSLKKAEEIEIVSNALLCITAADIHSMSRELLSGDNGSGILTNNTTEHPSSST